MLEVVDGVYLRITTVHLYVSSVHAFFCVGSLALGISV